MTILHHVISFKLAAAGAALMTVGAAAVFGSMTQPRPSAAPARLPALAPAWARAPVVPAGEPDRVTDWAATTDARFRVLFTYHRSDDGCAGPCQLYGLSVWFTEASGGAAEASERWLNVVHAGCATLTVDGRREELCEARDLMAGRDRRGNDYVMLPLFTTREQLVSILLSRKATLEVGGFVFELTPAARQTLRAFIGAAGREVPR